MQVEKLPTYGDNEKIIVRGAVAVAFDPIAVFWSGRHVALSRVEGEVYAHVFRRGRVHVDEVDTVLADIGAKPSTRSLVLGHIRRKFIKLGACDPFERLGNELIRLRVDANAAGKTAPVIGLTDSRYAKVGSSSTSQGGDKHSCNGTAWTS